MTLLEIRKQFVRLSGRHDLVTAGGESDNGANFFINAGQRYLDRQLDVGKAKATYFKVLTAGEHTVSIKETRSLHHVFLIDEADETRIEIPKGKMLDVRAYYSQPIPTLTPGKPICYYPSGLRNHHLSDVVSDLFTEGLIPDDENYSGLVLCPLTDKAYILEVEGLFYSKPLALNTDKTHWSEVHPDLLITAALYKLEGFYRNFEGVKDYQLTLSKDIADLDKDAVAQQIVDVDQMEG